MYNTDRLRAKDLMPNDWVKLGHHSAFENYKKVIVVDTKYDTVKLSDHNDYYDIDLVPIALTSEMMELNGFVLNKEEYDKTLEGIDNELRSTITIHFYDDYIFVGINVNKKQGSNSVHLMLNYIHEFQHALRLVGLSEISDNFKVKEGYGL